jgi:predicted dehydrogenase
MSQRSYRTAIVGTGAIAAAHARAVHATGDRARVVAAVDVDADRAKAFAETWELPRSYASVTELLLEEKVDVVHVCTPPQQHTPVAKECLEAGVNVVLKVQTTFWFAPTSMLDNCVPVKVPAELPPVHLSLVRL